MHILMCIFCQTHVTSLGIFGFLAYCPAYILTQYFADIVWDYSICPILVAGQQQETSTAKCLEGRNAHSARVETRSVPIESYRGDAQKILWACAQIFMRRAASSVSWSLGNWNSETVPSSFAYPKLGKLKDPLSPIFCYVREARNYGASLFTSISGADQPQDSRLDTDQTNRGNSGNRDPPWLCASSNRGNRNLPWLCGKWFDVSSLAGGELISKELFL